MISLMADLLLFFQTSTRLQVNTCPQEHSSIATLHNLQKKKYMIFNNAFDELNQDNENQQTEVHNDDTDDAN